MKRTIEIRKTLRRPNSLGQPAGERNRDGRGDDVGGQHPTHLVLRGRQRALHARQRDVGDGRVERLHDGREHDRDGDQALVRRTRGRVALASAIGSVPEGERAVMLGVDFDHDAHAGGQRQVGLARVDGEPHRQALHDLHPVARGVLRRQQREARAGAGAGALRPCR